MTLCSASGAVSLGQSYQYGIPLGGMTTGWSSASSGALTVIGGGRFAASGKLSVVNGALSVDGAGSKATVGNLVLGALAVAATPTSTLSSSASSGNVYLTNGGSLSVTGSVTDYNGGNISVSGGSFTVKGGLTYDVGQGMGMAGMTASAPHGGSKTGRRRIVEGSRCRSTRVGGLTRVCARAAGCGSVTNTPCS